MSMLSFAERFAEPVLKDVFEVRNVNRVQGLE